MELQKFMDIGSSKTNESLMDYMQVLEFFSITNPLEEEKLLSQEKSLEDYHAFQLGSKIYYISATWMQNATGGTLKTS